MLQMERVPTKYSSVTFKKAPELEIAFAELSLAMTLTPSLAEQIGHHVLPTLFRELPTHARLSDSFDDKFEANPDMGQAKFTFAIDPQILRIFPVEDPKIKKAILKLQPVDLSGLAATRDERIVKLAFKASFETGDGEQLLQLVRLLGETVYLSYEAVQADLQFDQK